MKIAGWKSISTVDVWGCVTFTLWMCGCNLKCPYCHNWRIADGIECIDFDLKRFLRDLTISKKYIDYLHITGGEPLIQWKPLIKLLKEVQNLDIKISLNTNLTLVNKLKIFINVGLIDHIATDIKVPPNIHYGVPSWRKLWKAFLKSLEMISDNEIPMELRIPIMKNISRYKEYLTEVFNILRYEDYYIVLNPLLGPPITSPRDLKWCSNYCNPDISDIDGVRSSLQKLGIKRIYINNIYLIRR